MTRQHSSAVRNRRSVSSAAETSHKPNKKYKVEYKLVTAEKKPLKISEGRPPPHSDYVFIATGSVEFTNFCKERCQKEGRVVYISNERQRRQEPDAKRVGYHVRRDGYYFPLKVVEDANDWLNYSVDKHGRPYPHNSQLVNALKRHGGQDEQSQIQAAMHELFPKMPASAAKEVVKRAFAKDAVGNAERISLPGRVQLAVNAHIRHQYTNYDTLLASGVPWSEARSRISTACIRKLREWRGEDGAKEFEETFQEWIDLRDENDDEELSSDEQTQPQTQPARPISLQRIPAAPESLREISRPTCLPRVPEHPQESVRRSKRRRSIGPEFARDTPPSVRHGFESRKDPIYQSVEQSPPRPQVQSQPAPVFSDPTRTLQFRPVHPEFGAPSQYAHPNQIRATRTAVPTPQYRTLPRAEHNYLPDAPRGYLQPAHAPRRAATEVIDLTSSPGGAPQHRPQRGISPPRFTVLDPPKLGWAGYGPGAWLGSTRDLERISHQSSDIPAYASSDTRPSLQETSFRGVLTDNRAPDFRATYPRPSRPAPSFGVSGFGETRREQQPEQHVFFSDLPPPPPQFQVPHPHVPTGGWTTFDTDRSHPIR